jgi:hypothetical protein
MQEPDAPLFFPATAVAYRRRGVPRARDAGAPRTARPRRGPGKPGLARVRAPSQTAPPPCVRVAAKSLRLFPQHPSGAHTRTRPRRHMYTHTLIYCTGSGPATLDPAVADKWDRPVSTEEKDEDAGPRGGEAEAKSPAHGG